jgi:hypothetical protein
MKTLMRTVHEMQAYIVPKITMSEAEAICKNYSTSMSDVMIVALAVHNMFDNEVIRYPAVIRDYCDDILDLLEVNDISISSYVCDCLDARVAIRDKEIENGLV